MTRARMTRARMTRARMTRARMTCVRAPITCVRAFLIAAVGFVAGAAGAQEPETAPDLSYVIVDGASIPEPLSDVAANVERGLEIFSDPDRGGCAACHAAPGVDQAPSQPGPALDDVGARLSASAIRLWIVNPRALREETTMPAYYSLDAKAATPDAGPNPPPRLEPRLDGASIEDLVVFLESLK